MAEAGREVDARIQRFLAGDDVVLDREFFLFDIHASRAHAEGLEQIGILSQEELAGLARELAALADDLRSGAFVLDARFEDGHSAIEARLTERLGDAGRKIHTGRSRNDQVLVATRLWLKERVARVRSAVPRDRGRCARRAPRPKARCPCRATPTCSARWCRRRGCGGRAGPRPSSTTRCAPAIHCAWIDANPLGTAAGYGVNLPLARDHTTRRARLRPHAVSAAYAQLSRGKFELAALESLGSALLDLRRLAWDLSLFTTAEFGFVALAGGIHHRLLDHAEQAQSRRRRAAARQLRQRRRARTEMSSCSRCPRATSATCSSPRARSSTPSAAAWPRWRCCPTCCATSSGSLNAMRAAIEPSMYATDLAIDLAREGVPFREAYRQAADPARWTQGNPEASLAARVSPGASADLRLDDLRRRLAGGRAVPPEVARESTKRNAARGRRLAKQVR